MLLELVVLDFAGVYYSEVWLESRDAIWSEHRLVRAQKHCFHEMVLFWLESEKSN